MPGIPEPTIRANAPDSKRPGFLRQAHACGMAEPRIDLPLLESQIVVVRGRQVLMDAVLAGLYGVTTKALLQALRRNVDRFPADFVFQLEKHGLGGLRSQFVTSNRDVGRGGRRYLPYAFTEQGRRPPVFE